MRIPPPRAKHLGKRAAEYSAGLQDVKAKPPCPTPRACLPFPALGYQTNISQVTLCCRGELTIRGRLWKYGEVPERLPGDQE
jgi:hypothetical protein